MNQARTLLPLAMLTVVVLAGLLAGCRCPEVHVPGPATENPPLLKATTDLLDTAVQAKVWTDKDQEAFNEMLPGLPFDQRFRLAKKLTGLITSQRVIIARSSNQNDPPPMCTCVPAQCDNGATPGAPGAHVTP